MAFKGVRADAGGAAEALRSAGRRPAPVRRLRVCVRQKSRAAAPADDMRHVTGFRELALGFPEAVESAHMGHPDFRVRGGKIFATAVAEGELGVLILTPEQQEGFVAEAPAMFVPVKGGWGRRGCTHVMLKKASKRRLTVALARGVAQRRRPASSSRPPSGADRGWGLEPAGSPWPPVLALLGHLPLPHVDTLPAAGRSASSPRRRTSRRTGLSTWPWRPASSCCTRRSPTASSRSSRALAPGPPTAEIPPAGRAALSLAA